MTENHKKLITSYDEQSKNLRAFMEEKGDNITADDLKEAYRMKADLADIRGKIKVAEEAAGLLKDADDARAYLDAPAQRHAHQGGNGGVRELGAKKAGETVFHKADGNLKRNKSMRVIRETGPGAFTREQFEAISQREYRDAFVAAFKGRRSHPHFRLLEEGTDPQGGYLAPVDVLARLIQRKPAPTSVSAYCDTIDTGRDRVAIPSVNYTGSAADDPDAAIYSSGVRVTMVGENPASDTAAQVNDTDIFGTANVTVYTFMLEAALTNNIIEDATFDPLSWIVSKFGEAISQHKDRTCIRGISGGPQGMLMNAGGTDVRSMVPVINTGTAATPFITPDSLINMTEDLPVQYDENVRYLYKRRTTGKTIRTFHDAAGRFLFGDGVQDSGLVPGRRAMLNGYPTVWSEHMPDPAAGAFPVIAGDFRGITVVNRIGFSVQILRELKALRNQVLVVGRLRYGVGVLEPWRLRALQVA
jgi:HK97 family phage major capsid protein